MNRDLIEQYEADGDLPAKAIAGLTRDEFIALGPLPGPGACRKSFCT